MQNVLVCGIKHLRFARNGEGGKCPGKGGGKGLLLSGGLRGKKDLRRSFEGVRMTFVAKKGERKKRREVRFETTERRWRTLPMRRKKKSRIAVSRRGRMGRGKEEKGRSRELVEGKKGSGHQPYRLAKGIMLAGRKRGKGSGGKKKKSPCRSHHILCTENKRGRKGGRPPCRG